MKKTSNIFFCTIIALMLLVPLLLTNTDEGAVSSLDGRTLLNKPAFDSDDFTGETELWLRDRLGLRDICSAFYIASNDILFRELIDPVYQYGSDDNYFFRIHNNIEYSEYHKAYTQLVYDMQQYCESRGTKFYYVFNPEKESVYKRSLPAGVNYNDAWVDLMLADMNKLGINYIDLRQTLIETGYEEKVFNRKVDAGSWNQYGGFCGMKEITKRIHRDIPEVGVLESNEYDINTVIANANNNYFQKETEEIVKYELKAKYDDITGDYDSELIRDRDYPYFQLVHNDSEEASGIKSMLLFGDSMYAPFAFARSRETVSVTCVKNAVNFEYFYNIFTPDVVIFENLESVVTDHNFSQTDIEAKDRNPAIMKNYPESGFAERREALLDVSQSVITNNTAAVIAGSVIDKVFIDYKADNAKYYYLITDNRVIDLTENDSGALTASIRHGDLSAETNAVLYFVDKDGNGYYDSIPVTSDLREITEWSDMSDKVSFDSSNNSYVLLTEDVNADFNYTVIQLMGSDVSEPLKNISSYNAETGTLEDAYYHDLDTGEYIVAVRGNAGPNDEYVAYKVTLTKGKTYWYSLTVDEFSGNKITLKDFSFSEIG